MIAPRFEEAAPPEDLRVEVEVIPELKSVLRTHGFVASNWTLKEDKNGRTLTISGTRNPWEQTEIPFEGEIKVEGRGEGQEE